MFHSEILQFLQIYVVFLYKEVACGCDHVVMLNKMVLFACRHDDW